jgi:hypothetical protein
MQSILKRCVIMLAIGVSHSVHAGDSAAGGKHAFDGKISREVLENYLARSINMNGLADSDQLDEDLRMLKNTGAKYIGRAALVWWSDKTRLDIEKHFAAAYRAVQLPSPLRHRRGGQTPVGPPPDATAAG